MALEGDGSLYFPPTAVCSQSQRSHRIQNQSHLPLRLVGRAFLPQYKLCVVLFGSLQLIVLHDRFQWNIPEDDLGLISVEPEAGVLQPNENSVSHESVTSTFPG